MGAIRPKRVGFQRQRHADQIGPRAQDRGDDGGQCVAICGIVGDRPLNPGDAGADGVDDAADLLRDGRGIAGHQRAGMRLGFAGRIARHQACRQRDHGDDGKGGQRGGGQGQLGADGDGTERHACPSLGGWSGKRSVLPG